MPCLTDRQQQRNALLDAYIVHFLAKLEADSMKAGDDTDSDDTTSSSSSDDDDEDPISDAILSALEQLHKERYIEERRDIPKTQENMRLLLDNYRHKFPDLFRSYVRVTPDCFNQLVHSIEHHPVFSSNSNNCQMPIQEQVAIALYRFGHYGNAASTMKVALWAGVGYGTVKNATIRVMTAICDPKFRSIVMPWSDPMDIEWAKAWVEGNSCPAWRDGWIMVDGTLVPLFQRPHHYGNTYFDRKSNYSMNVQIINRPDLRIIDYGIGLPGSQHDATAWEQTRLPHEHAHLLDPGEFVWADTAYPLKLWCQSPYKEPEKLEPQNATHNYYVSRVRIRSEHCMGYLKGRWSSLRGLRLRVDHSEAHQFATLWIATCIHLHNFAIGHEQNQNPEADSFFIQGQRIMDQDRNQQEQWRREHEAQVAQEEGNYGVDERIELLEGKVKREELKKALLEYLGMNE